MGNSCDFSDLTLDQANDKLCQHELRASRGVKSNSIRLKKKNSSFP